MSKPSDRPFRSGIPPEVLSSLQHGSLRYSYRGVTMRKNPLDLAIYTQLLYDLKPGTIIEIGTLEGGSALWFADLLTSYGVQGRVYSIDHRNRPRVSDPRITFMRGDALALADTLATDLLRSLEKPWLVIDDSAHQYEATLAVLRFFHEHLATGDYIVIEDGIVNDLPEPRYREYSDGPNRAVRAFLSEYPGCYEIDAELCDLFGYNFTFNPNGYLRRLA